MDLGSEEGKVLSTVQIHRANSRKIAKIGPQFSVKLYTLNKWKS